MTDALPTIAQMALSELQKKNKVEAFSKAESGTQEAPSAPLTSVRPCTNARGSAVAAKEGGPAPGEMDVEKTVDFLKASAEPAPTHRCAKYVRRAIEAGGVPLDPATRPLSAKNYGPYLKAHGFAEVPPSDHKPQPGDVAVIQPYPGGSTHGHIAMYDGEHWVSDFKQKDMWGGPGYRTHKPPVKIFRNLA